MNFLRNVGAARDTHQGGGTYGYGKTSLYGLSSCSTILVDTQCTNDGKPVRRLMGCQLGAAFEAETTEGSRRFTGRHWWGAIDDELEVDPLQGELAAELALKVGLPARDETARGTSIMILSPYVDHQDPIEIGHDIVETLLWNFWPRMTESMPDERRLWLSIEVNGHSVECPRPEDFPPLDRFAEALRQCRSGEEAADVWCQKPKKRLGVLSIQRGLKGVRRPAALRQDSLIPAQAAAIAVMRPVELVVKYIEGEPFPDRRFEWGGVFICSNDDEVEQAFASSEPPAHDDWIPDNLPRGRQKTYVNVALRRLREASRLDVGSASSAEEDERRGPSLARTASRMGRLLEGASARGSEPSPRRNSPRRSTRGVGISRPRFVELETGPSGERLAKFEAEYRNDGSRDVVECEATAHLVMDGGAASSDGTPLRGEPIVRTLRAGRFESKGHSIALPEGVGRLVCLVEMLDDAAAGVRFRLVDQAAGSDD